MSSRFQHIKIASPARVCLFGDHQDYLELPIIAGAIDRYMYFEARANNKDCIEINMPDIQFNRTICLNEPLAPAENEIDFFLSGLRVVRRAGCVPNKGFELTIKSEIPINAGVSSSSALVVGWIHLLLHFYGAEKEINAELIARLAYEAEVIEHNSPGGKMDQYTISLGHLIYLETGNSLEYELFHRPFSQLILVESGIPKETLGTLRNIRALTQKAIEMVLAKYPRFNLKNCTEQDISRYSSVLPESLKPYFGAAIKNHGITQQALAMLHQDVWDMSYLGGLMSRHHKILKDDLGVSHPAIDQILAIGIESGAYGGKIVGSGGGGCAVLLAPSEIQDQIIKALFNAGIINAYPVEISKGSYKITND